MATEEARKEEQAATTVQAAPPGAPEAAPQEGIRLERVAEPDLKDRYANFFTVMGTNEEVALEFGNLVGGDRRRQRVQVNARVYVSYYTAKRMLAALHRTVQQYEQRFGALELNVENRLLPSARVAAQQARQAAQP